MADEYYPIPAEPQYREQIRKLQNSDPASADGTFNPLIAALIENTAAVKKQADAAKQTLEKTTTPTQNIALAAEDLPAYIDALPRLLTNSYIISVTGELSAPLEIQGFHGSGYIQIYGGSNSDFTMRNIVTIDRCSSQIILQNMNFFEPANLELNYGLIDVDSSQCVVRIRNCSFTGLGDNSVTSAVSADYGSRAAIHNMSVQKMSIVALSQRASIISVYGGAYSANKIGAYVAYGSIVLIATSDVMLGGTTHKTSGGIVTKNDGTLYTS